MANKRSFSLIFIKQLSAYMASKLLAFIVLALALLVTVQGWCYKTHFAETSTTLNQIDFSPDRTMVVTSSNSRRMIVWNFTNLQPIFTHTFPNSVKSAKFSKNQNYIAVGQGSNTVTIIQVSNFSIHINLTTTSSSVNEVDFSWDNTRLLVCGSNTYQIFYTSNWAKETNLSNGGTSFTACKFQKNNQYATGDNNGRTTLYNGGTNAVIWTDNQSGSSNSVIALDFDMVNWTLITAMSGGQRFIIYPSARQPTGGGTNQNLNRSVPINSNVNSVAFSKDGSVYAIGVQSYVLIYENSTNRLLFNWTGTGTVMSGVFSYDSQYYISGSTSGMARVFKRSCQACPAGTFQSSTGCPLCSSAMIGCLSCANSSYCFVCGDGYAVDTVNFNCTLCHNSIPGCVLCNSTTICTACSSLYYLAGNSCTSCQTIPNCVTCNSSSTCIRCNGDFYLDASTSKCLPCGVNNCVNCYNATACISCASGYYLDAGNLTCILCRQNCTDCYNATACNQCVESYYLNSSSLCTNCPSNCLACNSTTCTRCIISYYTNGTGCMPCSGGCYVCSNSYYCFVCIPGYFQSSGTCTPCSGNCLTCTSATVCLSCNVNFYFAGATNTCNKCQNLLAGCLECTNTTCLRCQSGLYYDGTSCVKCGVSYGCQTCFNSTFCTSCISGYVLSPSTGVCSLCGIGCSSCSNSTVCINCLPKYYLSGGVCNLCPANCPTCLNATYCLGCVQGFYVNSTQGCTNCNGSIPNCASCSASNYCTSCELGYSLNAANTSCVKCVWPCSLCNATQCNQCATGYYLSSGACSICPSNCSSCFSASLCTSCANGFYLTASNTCSSCLGLSAGCATCNQTTCLSCLTSLGYYLTSGMNCTLCSSISNCLSCRNSSFCSICSFGYYSSAGACSPCTGLVSNCQSCNNSACLNCMDPYYLSGSTCQLCAQGCSACYNGTTCKACLTGYLFQTGSCTYCDTLMNGCQVCTSTTVCTECAQGYIVSGTSCSPCNSLMPGCQFCNGTSVCLTCMDQYYLNGSNSCAKCDTMPGCSQCNTSSVCLSCQSGYYKTATNACSQCADVMCITCTNSTNCINCLSGYYFNSSGNCRQCSTQIAGCVLCNSSQCLQCQSGYYLTASSTCSVCQVNGCEICNAVTPTQCVTCSSLYYLSSNACYSCGLSMTGCLNCLSSTHCLKCMVGSYLAANFTCQSCFYLFKGCAECSATACTVCQGGYTMNVTSCATCIAFLPGCLYCTSTTVCLSCQSGYYAAASTCHSCGGITGCLDCSSATACTLCSDSYYLNSTDNLCYLCNSTLTGCISCSAAGSCKACLGNYGLSGGICTALKTISTVPYSQLRLVTEYIDKNYLKHRLIVKGTFNTQTAANLTQSSTITMVGSNSSMVLTIYNYRWVGQFELVFITNNPLGANFNTLYRPMPAARMLSDQQKPSSHRLLSSNINLNYQFQLDMTEPAIQSILPSSDHMGSLSLSNPATNPSFIRSVYTQLPYNYHYFGLVVTLLMLVIYFVKAAISVPQSDDQGEIISHVFVLRCGGVIFSLAYMEYIDYCYGFLTPDLPWLNLVTSDLAASPDLSPNSYLLFYANMTIASTYLSALCLVVALILIMAAIAILAPQRREGLKVVGIFFYNFFQVGLIMAGSMSIQGAYYNNLNYFTSNSLFYIIGILLFVVVGVVNLWMAVGSIHRINKVRVMVKTTLLSLLYVSPVYLIPIALGVQAIFIIAEYTIKKAAKLHPHIWLTNQILLNVALLALVLLSKSLLSVFIPSILVVVALFMDLFIHIREYRHQQQLVKVKEIQKLTNLMETQEKLNRTIKKRNNNIYESTKTHETGMSSTVFSQDLVFNGLDEDISSSKSPFRSKPKKEDTLYIFDDPQYL